MIITAKQFTDTASTLRTEHASNRTFSVELKTDGAVVSYSLHGVVADSEKDIEKPMPHQVHPAVAHAFVKLIDLWFSKCPWQQMPADLVRELLRVRGDFHGAYIESL
uniref:Uncharacterized protein n=1 Tax=Pseudomonas phage HRDY3 TaxID=3236930 RepID=A0AB39CDX1_9VIRU